MDVGKAIYQILQQSSVVGTYEASIHPLVAKETTRFPFVVYEVTQDDPTDTKDGVSGLDTYRLDIFVYSTEYSNTCLISNAVRGVLDRAPTYPHTIYNGVVLQSISFQNITDEFEPQSGGRGIFRQRLEFEVREIRQIE